MNIEFNSPRVQAPLFQQPDLAAKITSQIAQDIKAAERPIKFGRKRNPQMDVHQIDNVRIDYDGKQRLKSHYQKRYNQDMDPREIKML